LRANFCGAAICREEFELFQNFRDNFYGAAICREKFELFKGFETFLPCCHLSGKNSNYFEIFGTIVVLPSAGGNLNYFKIF
jgi:hypothetical protein